MSRAGLGQEPRNKLCIDFLSHKRNLEIMHTKNEESSKFSSGSESSFVDQDGWLNSHTWHTMKRRRRSANLQGSWREKMDDDDRGSMHRKKEEEGPAPPSVDELQVESEGSWRRITRAAHDTC
jgi:hypothetical protein